MAFNFKDVFEKQAEKNSALQSAIAAVKGKPFREFLKGINFQVILHEGCKIIIAIRDTYCKDQNITVEEMKKAMAEYIDKKIDLPIYLEPFDGMVFELAIDLVMKYIEKQAAEEIETLKTAMLSEMALCEAVV